MGKRKRTGDAPASEAPVAKKQAKENGATAAEKRQQRSERKSKKPQQSKDTITEELLPGKATTEDSFAHGEDFVSLETTTKSGAPATTAKRSGPRQQRKAYIEAKTAALEAGEEPPPKPDRKGKAKDAKPEEKTSSRFIVFVGNLPFSTTTPQIAKHFAKLSPAHIRHSTDKKTGQSRGFAFLEFDDYSAMKTCLKVYHHSNFDPERTAKLPESAFDENGLEIGNMERKTGRRINVELTAGGGGKGAGRKEKIQKKNTKLFEERERRKKEEIKQEEKEGKNKKSEVNTMEIGAGDVHPSRMKRVPNAKD